jgi:hypothetical protein
MIESASHRAALGRVLPDRTASRAAAPAPRRGGGAPGRLFLAILLILPLAVSLGWLPYYLAPVAERVRNPLHELLRPSGIVGQSFGVAALALLLLLWTYPFRRMLGAAPWSGSLAGWLRIHTFAGIAIPLIAAVHAGWRFKGLVGLGYGALVVVSLSGFIGRYLYARIPHSKTGLQLTREEIVAERRTLVTEISARLGVPPQEVERALDAAVHGAPVTGVLGTLKRFILDDWARWRATTALRRAWGAPRAGAPRIDSKTLRRALRLAREEIRLTQQARLLDATHRVFRYWHVAHRPVAITGLLAVVIHVGVAYATGHTWLR